MLSLHRLAGELTLRVEEADRLHLIADEVDPHRQVLCVGVDVDQTTTDGKLPRHIDVVRLLEAQRPESLAERLPLILLPERDVDMPRLILRLVGKALRQRRRIGDDDPWWLSATPQPISDLAPEHLIGRIWLSVSDAATVERGEEKDLLLAPHQGDQVTLQVARTLLIVTYEEEGRHLCEPICQLGKEERRGGAG